MSSSYSPHNTQHSPDSAFELQPTFNFDDSHSQPHNARKIMEARDDAQGVYNSANPEHAFESDDFSFPDGTENYSQPSGLAHILDPANTWPNSSIPGGFNGLFAAPNTQGQIVQDRSASVQQNFGQITPPDEVLSDFTSNKFPSPAEPVPDGPDKIKSDKSERARKAANQRHAKSKQQRSSRQSIASSHSGDEDGEEKKEKYREKNRLAAAKCRAKKKTNIEIIEEKHRDLSAMNSVLRKQVQELRGELTGLRTHALSHQDCNCQIAQYNLNQAKKMTMGVDVRGSAAGFGSFSMIPSAVTHCDREHPSTTKHSPNMSTSLQRQSFASPSDYPFTTPEDMNALQDEGDDFGGYVQADFGDPMDFSQQ